MKRNLTWTLLALLLFAVTGCGGGDHERPLLETVIASDPAVDGDIVEALDGTRTVSLVGRDNIPGVLAGVDPSNDDVYRAFLSFPLASVPGTARISSATLSIVIRSVTVLPPTATIPVRIDLVSFDPTLIPPLVSSYFDRTLLIPMASTTIIPPISSADVNREVNVDVTPLMVEAQLRRLRDFQVRIMQDNDFGTTIPGLIEIDEASVTNEPRLSVVYF